MISLQTKSRSFTTKQLVALYNLILDNKDEKNAIKIAELYEKIINDKFIVSFTGHFSAGKSSMINSLLEEEILPKSPIPTSGNIVEITSGKAEARVYFNSGPPKVYEKPYDVELIKEYCKDNESIKKVELSTTENILPKGCVIVDTPGIDAADDADRIMTESSLHLVDRLFYVMDYNHVQSDVNLHFLKQIQEKGIPFYIIINQIDKHNEAELPFTKFDESVKQTFDQWNIFPESLFYTSLMDPLATHNDYLNVKRTLFNMLTTERDSTFTINQAVEEVIHNHKNYLQELFAQDNISISIESVEIEQDKSQTDLENILLEIRNQPEELKRKFQSDLNETLKNAYLMPATLRDKAESFLESQQMDFKVGLFGSKKKTELEKEERLESFLNPLQKNIEASIQWKLRDKIITTLTSYNVSNPELLEFTQQFSIKYMSADLISLIKPGAKINGDYILNYTKDVSADIKSKFKTEARLLWDEIQLEITKQADDAAKPYEKKLVDLEKINIQKENRAAIQEQLQEKLRLLDYQLENPVASESTWERIENALKVDYQKSDHDTTQSPICKSKVNKEEVIEKYQPDPSSANLSIEHIIESIDKTISTIESLPGFQDIIDDLLEKRHRLHHRTLTIALFGAFSAGKSSFANALLGEGLLPSSPNPTTAVINRISPVTEEHQHGTVIIELKEEQVLKDDLRSITKDLSPPETNLDELMKWIKEQKIDQNIELNNMYQSYLHALIEGYTSSKQNLGKEITIPMADFADFVTDETKACYIEGVTLYYDCSVTRLGISLVDTPGADSVNARHTNVAFEYIKQADAILYVTYYNHALSRADKNFLMQLGRVKDTFHLDKMFFIINAADLAENEAELQLVENYVTDQLVQLGIRFPKVFSVSSKLSLADKLNGQELNDQMNRFESDFYQFINDDLAAISIESALWDIHRASETMTNHLKTIDLNELEKEQYRNNLLENKELLDEAINKADATIFEERIMQRIDRQLHFVQERIAIRYNDFFQDTFNPTTISESGKKATVQLQNCLKNLIDYTGYELLQELRAVSLRIEAHLRTLTEEVHEDFKDRSKQIDSKFILPLIEPGELETPAYKQGLVDVDRDLFKSALGRFKGTKAFFEKNEKEIMKDAIYQILAQHIKEYIDISQKEMEQAYIIQWDQLFKASRQQVKENINNYSKNNLAMIENTSDTDLLYEKQNILSSIIDLTNQKGD